jgi:branched-chain amino acid transport system permease protein
MNYLLHIFVMICLYAISGLSLNLVVGYGGMLSLCHAAFYGIGAYTSTLLVMKAGCPFGLSALGGALAAGTLAYFIATASFRLHGDSFVLATMGCQVIVFSVLYNWVDLTRGPYGISGIPGPNVLGRQVASTSGFLLLAAGVALFVGLVVRRLAHSAYGRTLRALRDDEIAAEALGKDVLRFKRSAFVISAMLAALAGVLYAGYVSYIDPTSFALDESIFVLCIVIIGGAGNVRGPIVGALVMVLLPEILRLLPIPGAVAANLRQIVYGLLLLLIMRLRPQGFAGDYAFD